MRISYNLSKYMVRSPIKPKSNSGKGNYNSELLTVNSVRYNGKFVSLIATYG